MFTALAISTSSTENDKVNHTCLITKNNKTLNNMQMCSSKEFFKVSEIFLLYRQNP